MNLRRQIKGRRRRRKNGRKPIVKPGTLDRAKPGVGPRGSATASQRNKRPRKRPFEAQTKDLPKVQPGKLGGMSAEERRQRRMGRRAGRDAPAKGGIGIDIGIDRPGLDVDIGIGDDGITGDIGFGNGNVEEPSPGPGFPGLTPRPRPGGFLDGGGDAGPASGISGTMVAVGLGGALLLGFAAMRLGGK